MQLVIGNKNYSSWSMRPWVLLKQAGIDFEEVMVRFDDETGNAKFKAALSPLTPTAKVPLLVDGNLAVWDSLAIVEYVAEQFSGTPLWPQEKAARARARSICAEMHSGFTALRSACSMNIEADLRNAGALIWRDNAGVRADVARLTAMWEGLIAQYGGPMLFGSFSVADAYFAPVCSRLKTYGLPTSPVVQAYINRVWALPGVQAWVNDAFDKELIVSSPGENSRILFTFMQNQLGVKFRILTGYKGPNEARLAMEQGEVHGDRLADSLARTGDDVDLAREIEKRRWHVNVSSCSFPSPFRWGGVSVIR